MTLAEFKLWAQDYNQNPWGERRDDLHAAQIQSAIARYAGKQVADGIDVKTEDFVLRFVDPDEQAPAANTADEAASFSAHFKLLSAKD